MSIRKPNYLTEVIALITGGIAALTLGFYRGLYEGQGISMPESAQLAAYGALALGLGGTIEGIIQKDSLIKTGNPSQDKVLSVLTKAAALPILGGLEMMLGYGFGSAFGNVLQ